MKTPFIIAEIGQAHDGSLGMAHAYIEAISKTGADAIKFQTHIAEAESSLYEPFRVRFSEQDITRFDYWKRMEFTLEQWIGLKQHCEDVNLEFMSSPFSNAAVDLLEKVGLQRYKVGSGEVTNTLLLDKIVQTKKPVILSSGMSSYDELDIAVSLFKKNNMDISVLQCTTAYPTLPSQYGLNVIKELKDRYKVKVGFSDHSAKIETCIAAAALGAEIFEVHAVFNKNMFGPDVTSSLEIDEITKLVLAISNLNESLASPINKNDLEGFKEIKGIFEKSLAINKPLKKDHKITFSDLEAKKPANKGIRASEYRAILGKKLVRDMDQWEFLNETDIS